MRGHSSGWDVRANRSPQSKHSARIVYDLMFVKVRRPHLDISGAAIRTAGLPALFFIIETRVIHGAVGPNESAPLGRQDEIRYRFRNVDEIVQLRNVLDQLARCAVVRSLDEGRSAVAAGGFDPGRILASRMEGKPAPGFRPVVGGVVSPTPTPGPELATGCGAQLARRPCHQRGDCGSFGAFDHEADRASQRSDGAAIHPGACSGRIAHGSWASRASPTEVLLTHSIATL